jgi:hypothetical protein
MIIFKEGQTFAPNSPVENAQILANLLPNGDFFTAKNNENSTFRKVLTGFSYELTRIQDKQFELNIEHDLTQTVNLIDRWETCVGIPDGCFKNTETLEQRRKQVIAKIAKMNISTAQEFIDLAAYLGYRIQILFGQNYGFFPMKFPILLGDYTSIRFTVIIKFIDLTKPVNAFPMQFPFQLGGTPNVIICIFAKLIQANIKLLYVYKDF